MDSTDVDQHFLDRKLVEAQSLSAESKHGDIKWRSFFELFGQPLTCGHVVAGMRAIGRGHTTSNSKFSSLALTKREGSRAWLPFPF